MCKITYTFNQFGNFRSYLGSSFGCKIKEQTIKNKLMKFPMKNKPGILLKNWDMWNSNINEVISDIRI